MARMNGKQLQVQLQTTHHRKYSVSSLLKCFWFGAFCWCAILMWIFLDTATQDMPNINNRKALEIFTYVIPSELFPKHRVPVLDRNLDKEKITTPDGRKSHISTEAFREFGDVIRSLIQQGRGNLSSRGSRKSTLLFRERLHALSPWLKGDPKDPSWPHNTFPTPIDGRAIVICAGDPQLRYLKNLVHSIRVDHRSNMPIKIIFLDELDLTPPSRAEVESVIPHGTPKNLDFVDLSHFFHLKQVHLKGWDLKAYGLLAVPENEVMLLDVDVILLQPPEIMFEQEGYKDKGVLFFHDRMLMDYRAFCYDPGTFAMALQPSLSLQAQRLIHNGNSPYMSEHIQESGMIIIDKTRRILGLWATCLIYGREDVRKYAQGYYVYGDKEMYWISFETIAEPYAFANYYPGTFGGIATDFEFNNVAILPTDKGPEIAAKLDVANENRFGLCGRLVHFDSEGRPLWSNGGYLTKEEEWPSTTAIGRFPLNPVWYVDGGDWTREELVPTTVVAGPVDKFWAWISPNPLLEETYIHWERVKDYVPLNQDWRSHDRIGANCLMANSRGIQQVPPESYAIALKAVERCFLVELGKEAKYETYFLRDVLPAGSKA